MKYTIKTDKIENKNIDKLEFKKTLKHVKHAQIHYKITNVTVLQIDRQLESALSYQNAFG